MSPATAAGEDFAQLQLYRSAPSFVDQLGLALLDADFDGYAGMRVADNERVLYLYWAGPRPLNEDVLVSQADAAGVQLRIVEALHSIEDLEAARDLIANDPGFGDSGITGIGLRPDGSGLDVGVVGDRSKAAALASVRDSAVPIHMEDGPRIDPGSRWQDTSPFSGGAAFRDLDDNLYCSTAFGVRRRSNNMRLLLTASHCLDLPGEAYLQGGGALQIGVGRDRSTNTDSGIIEPNNALFTSGARIYTGSADMTGVGTGENSMRISGRGVSVADRMTVSNGAFTGQRASIRITHPSYSYYLQQRDGREYFTNGVRAVRDDRSTAVGQGDSGGPMTHGTLAMGVISAIDLNGRVTCSANPSFYGERICSSIMFYTDINLIRDAHNIEVSTS